jgi:hypothetical protein
VESPLTSPASIRRRSRHERSEDDDSDSDLDMSVREASPESHRQPSVSDDVENSDEEANDVHHEGEAHEEHHDEVPRRYFLC